MKVFLTGATGVIGRPTVARLVEAGHEVRAVARRDEAAAAAARRPAPNRSRSTSSTPTRCEAAVGGVDAIAAPGHERAAVPEDGAGQGVGDAQPAAHRGDPQPRRRRPRARDRPDREGVDHLHLRGRRRRVARRVVAAHRQGRADARRRSTASRSRSSSPTPVARAVVLRFGLFYGGENRGTDEMLRLARWRARRWSRASRTRT